MDVSPKIVLVDPSLRDIRGHHYELAANVTHGAHTAGYEVVWLVHKDFPRDVHPENVAVHGVFDTTMYDRFVVPNQSSARPDSKLAEVARKFAWRIHSARERIRLLAMKLPRRLWSISSPGSVRVIDSMSDILWATLNSAGISDRDHLLIHTADGSTYSDVLDLVLKRGTDMLPYIHVCTPYDMSTMPHQHQLRPVRKIIEYLSDLGVVGYKLFLYGENDLLAESLGEWFGCDVDVLNLPAPRAADQSPEVMHTKRPITVCYLGAAREEKGFLILPDLVEAMAEKNRHMLNIRFVIQCSPQIIGYKPSIVDAIRRLKSFPSSYVELRENVQSTHDYYRMLRESDVILMCYDAKKYKHRGSGIAVEAVAMGKSILATKGTFPAYLAGEAAATGETVDEYVSALDDIILHFDKYRRLANQAGAEYRKKYSAVNYVNTLTAHADDATVSFVACTHDKVSAESIMGSGCADSRMRDVNDYRAVLSELSGPLRSRLQGAPGLLLREVLSFQEQEHQHITPVQYGRYLDRHLHASGTTFGH